MYITIHTLKLYAKKICTCTLYILPSLHTHSHVQRQYFQQSSLHGGPTQGRRRRGGSSRPTFFMPYIRPLTPKSYLKYAKPQHVHAEPAGADSALLIILDMSSSHSPAIMHDHK